MAHEAMQRSADYPNNIQTNYLKLNAIKRHADDARAYNSKENQDDFFKKKTIKSIAYKL